VSVILPRVAEALGERLGVGPRIGASTGGDGPNLTAPPSALPAALGLGERDVAVTKPTGRPP
jgi:hypothetical protein